MVVFVWGKVCKIFILKVFELLLALGKVGAPCLWNFLCTFFIWCALHMGLSLSFSLSLRNLWLIIIIILSILFTCSILLIYLGFSTFFVGNRVIWFCCLKKFLLYVQFVSFLLMVITSFGSLVWKILPLCTEYYLLIYLVPFFSMLGCKI